MAPRRGKRVKTLNSVDYSQLNFDEVLCPICRSILIEPVTLPCNHGYCSSCFDGTMRNANLVCPLCRIRVGSWFRIAKKENTLVNQELWKVIREKFSKEVDSKLKGIETDYVEEIKIHIATPGDIRKEYEQQKEREIQEMLKEKQVEENASLALIAKLEKEAEEYRQAIKEEQLKKIKFDEEIARKLSLDLSKSKKQGPLDNFFTKKINETITSNKFATKEYTCRVLCLDKVKRDENKPSTSKTSHLPLINSKIRQLQKLVDTEVSSDSNDSIELECRYFKPIDFKLNKPSLGKVPVKVPTKRPMLNSQPNILCPAGKINFKSNILESAFARFTLAFPTRLKKCRSSGSLVTSQDDSNINEDKIETTLSFGKVRQNYSSRLKKRSYDNLGTSQDDTDVSDDKIGLSKLKKYKSYSNLSENTVEIKNSLQKVKNSIQTRNNKRKINEEVSTLTRAKRKMYNNNNLFDNASPPFYGFDNSKEKKTDSNKDLKQIAEIKAKRLQEKIAEIKAKKLQEKSDLEFARKLQSELNRSSHYTTRGRIATTRRSKRQITLDEIVSKRYTVK